MWIKGLWRHDRGGRHYYSGRRFHWAYVCKSIHRGWLVNVLQSGPEPTDRFRTLTEAKAWVEQNVRIRKHDWPAEPSGPDQGKKP